MAAAFDLDYPPATRAARTADNRTAQAGLDWVAELVANAAPRDIARVAPRFRAVTEAEKPLAEAHTRCLQFLAGHDRDQAAASLAEAALLTGFSRAADALVAERGALPAAPFAGLARLPRDMAGLRAAPALELLLLPADLAAALPEKERGPKLAAALAALPALCETARRTRLAELESGAPAERADRDRGAAARALILAIGALEKDARQEGVWGRMAPGRRPFRAFVLIPLWLHRQVVDFGPFRRAVVNRSVRQWLVALLALLLLVLGVPPAVRAMMPSAQTPVASAASPGTGDTNPVPANPVASSAAAPGALVSAIFGQVANQDARDWRVLTDCRPSGKQDSGVIHPGSDRDFLLGYGDHESFHCPATLEGGTGSCTISWSDSCVIKAGVIGPGPKRQ